MKRENHQTKPTNANEILFFCFLFVLPTYLATRKTDKKVSGKSKDEQMAEKKQELEKRLQDVTGQLGSAKKAAKKGNCSSFVSLLRVSQFFGCHSHFQSYV